MENKQDVCDLLLNKMPIGRIQELIRSLRDDGSWWERNVDSRMPEFETWIGDPLSPSKIAVRKHVAQMNYKSILDCGCGLCSEYHGYKLDQFEISYTGLDQCKILVDKSMASGISVLHGSIEAIPLPGKSVEVSFARHVLEHLMGYEESISEMVRVASKAVIVVFFIPPADTTPPSSDQLRYDVVEGVWHNTYQKAKMEGFLKANTRIRKFTWEPLPGSNESILYVDLRE